MKNPIQRFPPNLKGRDFVIGDLHGALGCFENLLKNLNFDPTVDRMFSVTDLVDRGPESLKCLRLLKNDWFHGVLANHEQMLLEAFEGGYMGQFWLQNGGYWGYTAYEDYKASKRTYSNELDRPTPHPDSHLLWEMLDVIRELPFIITVEMPDGKLYHIIHAELPPGHLITDAELSSPGKVMELAKIQSHDGDYFIWGRFLFAQFHGKQLNEHTEQKIKRTVAHQFAKGSMFNDKLSHIISGHTIVQRPMTILGQTNIDTKAYGCYKDDPAKWHALTCIELKSWTFYQATPTEFRTVVPFTVNKADIAAMKTQPSTTPLIDSLNGIQS